MLSQLLKLFLQLVALLPLHLLYNGSIGAVGAMLTFHWLHATRGSGVKVCLK